MRKPRSSKTSLKHEKSETFGMLGFEERGIRKIIFLRDDADPRSTELASTFENLFQEAGAVLKRAGIFPEQINPSGLIDAPWLQGIADQRGYLSPEYIAAHFLYTCKSVLLKMSKSESLTMFDLAQLCDAWHWHHMETHGEHERAFKGAQRDKNLAKASTNRSQEQIRAKGIIQKCVERHSGRHVGSNQPATTVAKHIFDEVNAELLKGKLEPYTSADALAHIVRKLRRTKR